MKVNSVDNLIIVIPETHLDSFKLGALIETKIEHTIQIDLGEHKIDSIKINIEDLINHLTNPF